MHNMSKNLQTLQHYSPIMELQNIYSMSEVKRFTPFSVDDLLPPVKYSEISPASSSVGSPSSKDSFSQPSSPQALPESDTSYEIDPPTPNSMPRFSPKIQPTRKNRTSFTNTQVLEMERMFERKQYLEASERHQLAERIRITETQVKTWFQNRRMKRKRKRTEETQYYTKLAFANRLASGLPQPGNHGYQPPLHPSMLPFPNMETPRYPSDLSVFQTFSAQPFYPGVEIPPEVPGSRLICPPFCGECPGTDCTAIPRYSYPTMPMVSSSQDYAIPR